MLATITRAGRSDEYGRALLVGVTYDGTINQVRALVAAGYATTTESLFDGGSGGDALSPADGMTASQVAATQALVSGAVISGAWRNLPASGVIMRARMTGTGTLTMESATGDLGAGTVTTAAYAATVAGTQIDDYAYPGDAARSIRFILTGSAAVEVY